MASYLEQIGAGYRPFSQGYPQWYSTGFSDMNLGGGGLSSLVMSMLAQSFLSGPMNARGYMPMGFNDRNAYDTHRNIEFTSQYMKTLQEAAEGERLSYQFAIERSMRMASNGPLTADNRSQARALAGVSCQYFP